jgi:glutaminase
MATPDRKIDLNRLQEVCDEIAEEMMSNDEWGEASGQSKELAEIDTHQFGIAVYTAGDDLIASGKAEERFTIQSISKVFALTLALEAFGEKVWDRVGREPSGDPFNSIIDLERHKGKPRNPFINAGALVTIDLLLSRKGKAESVREFVTRLVGHKVGVNRAVANSSKGGGFGNRAMANLSKFFDNLNHDVDDVMDAYAEQCAVMLSCKELAKAGDYLMVEGADSRSAAERKRAERVRRINSLMLTCGQYDGSGEFAYRVGLPAKSGVGGGILAIAPNTASIAVWSPGLDANGNSLLGTMALARLAEKMDWSIFGSLRRR